MEQVISPGSREIITVTRVLRAMRVALVIRNINLASKVRQAISSQKTRYQKDGFDLDLTYINNGCIAMSLPALGPEANYRNPLHEVQLFFMTRHPENFMIFNLCREREYDPDLFEGRVERIEVEDHNPPSMNQIFSFMERAGQFVQEDPNNVIAVHCKGGKGRTGTMIAAWLLYSGFCSSSDDALDWFQRARTGPRALASQGVTQPSQRRYVHYTAKALDAGGFRTPALTLRKLVIKTCPRMDPDGGCDPWLTVEENGLIIYDHRLASARRYERMEPGQAELIIDLGGLVVRGDLRIVVYDHDEGTTNTSSTVPRLASSCCCPNASQSVEENNLVKDVRENGPDIEQDSSNVQNQAMGPENLFTGAVNDSPDAGDELCFFFWVHTGFIRERHLVLPKSEVDVASRDRRCRVFSDKFAVELFFDAVPPSDDASPTARRSTAPAPSHAAPPSSTPDSASAGGGEDVEAGGGWGVLRGPLRRLIRPETSLVTRAKRMRGAQKGDARAAHNAALRGDSASSSRWGFLWGSNSLTRGESSEAPGGGGEAGRDGPADDGAGGGGGRGGGGKPLASAASQSGARMRAMNASMAKLSRMQSLGGAGARGAAAVRTSSNEGGVGPRPSMESDRGSEAPSAARPVSASVAFKLP